MSELFDKSLRTLELPRVLELLSEQAVSAEAKQRALRVRPETEPEEVLRLLALVDWAGAGATVPLTGFGNTLVQGTKAAIREDGLLGVLTGPLSAGSAGITAAILCGLIVSFLAKPKSK